MKRAPEPKLDHLLPYLMNRLVAQLNQNLGERLRKLGYSFQEWRILAVLAAHDGITLSQLADATVIPQPSVSRLAARLEKRGFLQRRLAAKDSRYVEAWISARGREAYRRMLPLAIDEYRRAVVSFDERENKWLLDATARMIDNVGIRMLEIPGARCNGEVRDTPGSAVK
jgi:DNA-binding MarR family transcriptional regulator